MAVSCDPSTLANQARCFLSCVPKGMLRSLKSKLLCTYAQFAQAPSNVDIADASVFNDVIFTWSNTVPNATANQIWKSTNGGAFVLYATVAASTTSFHDPIALGFFTPDDLFVYKVRAVEGTQFSNFSETRSVVFRILKTGAADSSLSYPDLVMQLSNGGFGLFFNNMPNLTSFSAPLLRRVDDQFNFTNDTNLTSVVLPVLNSSGDTNSDNLFFDGCTKLPVLSLPKLRVQGGSGGNFHFATCTLLTTVDLSSFVTAGGDFLFNDCPALTSISCPSLTGVAEALFLQNNVSMTTASFPILLTIGTNLNMSGCTALVTASFPVLNDIQSDCDISFCTNSATFNFSLLANISGNLNMLGCKPLNFSMPALTNIGGQINANAFASTSANFPVLSNVGGDIDFHNSGNLTTISFPVLIIPNVGNTMNFHGCAIAAGVSLSGTGVNGFLHRGAVSGLTGGTSFDFQGGTSAGTAALSAQGVADVATLTGAGNVVFLNP